MRVAKGAESLGGAIWNNQIEESFDGLLCQTASFPMCTHCLITRFVAKLNWVNKMLGRKWHQQAYMRGALVFVRLCGWGKQGDLVGIHSRATKQPGARQPPIPAAQRMVALLYPLGGECTCDENKLDLVAPHAVCSQSVRCVSDCRCRRRWSRKKCSCNRSKRV